MKKIRISNIFDFLIGTSFLFLVFFVWTRYFVHKIWLTIIISSVLTFFAISIYHIIQTKRQNKKILSENEMKNAHQISTKFLLMTKQEILKEFEKYLSIKYLTKSKSDYLIINDNILRPIFSSATISDRDVIESYTKIKKMNVKKLIIVCQGASTEAKKIAELITDKKVVVLEEFDAFENIYKPLKFEIPKNANERSKKNIGDYVSFALKKERTKNYLIVAFFLLFSSFILRYNIYYVVFASITTMLGLYSYFNKRFNLPKRNKID